MVPSPQTDYNCHRPRNIALLLNVHSDLIEQRGLDLWKERERERKKRLETAHPFSPHAQLDLDRQIYFHWHPLVELLIPFILVGEQEELSNFVGCIMNMGNACRILHRHSTVNFLSTAASGFVSIISMHVAQTS